MHSIDGGGPRGYENRVNGFRFNPCELAGSMGDFGTLLRLAIGYITVCKMDPAGPLIPDLVTLNTYDLLSIRVLLKVINLERSLCYVDK